MGVNDLFGSDIEIGSTQDIDPNDYRNNKHTFIGYYAAIVSRYKQISPDAKFFFVTFPKNTKPPEENGRTLGMIEAMYSLAEYFTNSYVIDLFKYGPVYNKEFKDKFFLHGHLNPSGYILTAHMIDCYIDYIVRHNPQDFKTVGLIGTDIKNCD